MRGKQTHPTSGDLLVGPGFGGGINAQHDMDVIAHHGLGVQANGEDVRQLPPSLLDPVAAMLEGMTGQRVQPAQPGA